MADSDEDNDLFGADSDSDDTADLIQTSKTDKKDNGSKKSAMKKPAAQPKKSSSSGGGGGGLFDSDSDEDGDDNDLDNMDTKKKRLEALAQKRKKKEPAKAPSSKSGKRASSSKDGKPAQKNGEGGGYESAESYDSNDIQRTADDDNFIDTAGEDPEAVNELYSEQRFDDDDERTDKSQKKMKKRRAQQGQPDDDANDPIMSVINRMKKKKTEKKSQETIEQEVHVFLNQMHVAAERDEVAVAERVPALNKLNMLSDVCDMLTKKDMQRTLLDEGLLKECKMCTYDIATSTSEFWLLCFLFTSSNNTTLCNIRDWAASERFFRQHYDSDTSVGIHCQDARHKGQFEAVGIGQSRHATLQAP
jgi:hypothetical protein